MSVESLTPAKIKSVIGMLESDQDGEVLAAVRHLIKIARSRKLKLNELLVVSGSAPAPDAKPKSRYDAPPPTPPRWRETDVEEAMRWARDFGARHQKEQEQSFTDAMNAAKRRASAFNWTGKKHSDTVREILKRINAKAAGTTILTPNDQAFLAAVEWALNNGMQITASQAQQLGVLARRVGAQ